MPRSVMLVVLFALWSGAALAVDSHDTLLLAQPDISERNITFVYDGDVWVANSDGSGASGVAAALLAGRRIHCFQWQLRRQHRRVRRPDRRRQPEAADLAQRR